MSKYLLLLIIGLMSCTYHIERYCYFEVYQGGHIINRVCRPCEMSGEYDHSTYYKQIPDNTSCNYLNKIGE